MNLGAIVEKQAGLRFRRARLLNPIYRRAFRTFGRGSTLMAPLMLQGVGAISLGADVLFRDGAWLATEPGGTLSIGDHNYFGHRAHLHAASAIVIGDNCTFADNVFVANAEHGREDRTVIEARGPIEIGDNVFLGQNVVVLGGVTIGDGATVGAGSVVTKDVAPGTVVVGVPARPIGTRG